MGHFPCCNYEQKRSYNNLFAASKNDPPTPTPQTCTSLKQPTFNKVKSIGVICNLPVSDLSASHFKLAKSFFSENLDVSMPVAPFKSDFVA